MSNEKTHSVYVLSDSRNPDVIRYIGRAIDPEARLTQHRSSNGMSRKDSWAREVMRSGGDIVMRIIRDGLSRSEVIAAEKTCIKLMFSLGYDLLNTADFSKPKYVARKIDDELEIAARKAAAITISSEGVSGEVVKKSLPNHMKPPRNNYGIKGVVKSGDRYRVWVNFSGGHISSDSYVDDAKMAATIADFVSHCFYEGDCYLNKLSEFTPEVMRHGYDLILDACNKSWTDCPFSLSAGSDTQKRGYKARGKDFESKIVKCREAARKMIGLD